jgi:hypothetical protein
MVPVRGLRNDAMWEETIPLTLNKYVIVDILESLHGCVCHIIVIINGADDFVVLFQSVATLSRFPPSWPRCYR